MLHGFRHFLFAGPFTGTDHQVAGWFGHHLSGGLIDLMLAMSQPGSAPWIAVVLSLSVAYLTWKRRWHALLTLLFIVPGGMLLNTAIKFLIHRHRPIVAGSFPHWDGYSFPSGHTIGATLLYGMILLALVPLLQRRRWKALMAVCSGLLVFLVGFSRIALGAHYLTDVVGAIVLGIAWLAACRTCLLLFGRWRYGPASPIQTLGRIVPARETPAAVAA